MTVKLFLALPKRGTSIWFLTPIMTETILALDISTNTGWALFRKELTGFTLMEFGCIDASAHKEVCKELTYPWDYVELSRLIAKDLYDLTQKYQPFQVVIEESNKARQRYSQKRLEQLHFQYLNLVNQQFPCYYVDTSAWRKTISLRLTKEDKEHNKLVKAKKSRGKITSKHLSVRWCNEKYDLSLKQKDNDIADAICLGSAFLLGAPLSPGK